MERPSPAHSAPLCPALPSGLFFARHDASDCEYTVPREAWCRHGVCHYTLSFGKVGPLLSPIPPCTSSAACPLFCEMATASSMVPGEATKPVYLFPIERGTEEGESALLPAWSIFSLVPV